ncbi:MAG: tRNA (adenosine(37)-N6)-threonylcarbamoyltransferase complex transferase subunit TsaD [Bacteroidales bacterium]|nr:tRNA (adenosine(37)-N6)-threonylcarbamoyltransferase complex transferase subunit TsaD [Bacteroidales bacterium]
MIRIPDTPAQEKKVPAYILGIETSCDDTAAAVIRDHYLLSNVIAGQAVHERYGGVVPELASRAHQQHIIPVVEAALQDAGVTKEMLHAVAYTRGPGLMGSLLVGTSFAKTFAMGLDIPLIEADHLDAHILAHFIEGPDHPYHPPEFPFLCLTVSGGHTLLVVVEEPSQMKVIGRTIDDAAGEAFDKAAKILGLPYPGGPAIDKLAKEGNPSAYPFPKPRIPGLNMSFSGLKTSFLYFIRDRLREDTGFISSNLPDLCASIQNTIVEILMEKLEDASSVTGIRNIALAGGVSANTLMRAMLTEAGTRNGWKTYIPHYRYTTDNAAMVAITGYFKYIRNDFSSQESTPYTRTTR